MRKVVVAQVGIGLAVLVLALVYLLDDPSGPAAGTPALAPLPGDPPAAGAPPAASAGSPDAPIPRGEPPAGATKLPPGAIEGPGLDKLPPQALADERPTGLPPAFFESLPAPAEGPVLTPEQLREARRSGDLGPDPARLRPDQLEALESGGELRLRPGQTPPTP
jgi:hypothetical protein